MHSLMQFVSVQRVQNASEDERYAKRHNGLPRVSDNRESIDEGKCAPLSDPRRAVRRKAVKVLVRKV